MSAGKKSKKLSKKTTPRPKFVMAEPNDDAEAFGWTLGKLRHLVRDRDGKKWPGRGVFDANYNYDTRQLYGHVIDFINPAFLQIQLDSNKAIRAGAIKVRDAGYTKEAIEKFQATVLRVFTEEILPDIAARFKPVAGLVAEFYAARLAHIEKFGNEE
ncbi:hypothetical protein EBZ39_04720 [bacterium]|nr:hypothetical protein [bacterium]